MTNLAVSHIILFGEQTTSNNIFVYSYVISIQVSVREAHNIFTVITVILKKNHFTTYIATVLLVSALLHNYFFSQNFPVKKL